LAQEKADILKILRYLFSFFYLFLQKYGIFFKKWHKLKVLAEQLKNRRETSFLIIAGKNVQIYSGFFVFLLLVHLSA